MSEQPQHERADHGMPQRHPVPTGRPHPEDSLPRRTPGSNR